MNMNGSWSSLVTVIPLPQYKGVFHLQSAVWGMSSQEAFLAAAGVWGWDLMCQHGHFSLSGNSCPPGAFPEGIR